MRMNMSWCYVCHTVNLPYQMNALYLLSRCFVLHFYSHGILRVSGAQKESYKLISSEKHPVI